MREVEAAVWEQYGLERSELQRRLALQLQRAMHSLVDNPRHADLTLVCADGQRMAAHLAMLRQRAPGFYQKYVIPAMHGDPKMRAQQRSPANSRPNSRSSSKTPPPRKAAPSGQKLSVPVSDVPYEALKFFITSIYTEDEVPQTPHDAVAQKSRKDDQDEPPSKGDEKAVKFAPGVKPGSPRKPLKGAGRPAATVKPLGGGNEGGVSSSSSHNTFTMDDSRNDDDELDRQPELPETNGHDEADTSIDESLRQLSEPVQVPLASSAAARSGMRTSFQELREARSADMNEDRYSTTSERPVLMTSFRELAFESPFRELNPPDEVPERRMSSAAEADIFTPDSVMQFPLSPESIDGAPAASQSGASSSPEKEDRSAMYAVPERRDDREEMMMAKFIRFQDMAMGLSSSPPPSQLSEYAEPHPQMEKKMFPIFIEFGSPKPIVRPASLHSEQMEATESNGFLPSFPFRKRLSVTSLRSLESVDISPSQEGMPARDSFPPQDQDGCSRLGDDLLTIFLEQIDTDLIVETKDGEIRAHRAVLTATCPYFAAALNGEWKEAKSGKLQLNSYSYPLVHFALSFLYGGLTTVPEGVNGWELLSLADMMQLETLREVTLMHLKAKTCHFFHRPCATCVPTIFDSLSRFESLGLTDLLLDALNWQAKYFSRVWKSRGFLSMSDEWQKKCYWAIIDRLCPENVIQILISCEKLQLTLPRTMKGGLSTEPISSMVACLLDAGIEFLASNFDHVIPTESFINQGRGLALNLGLLEDILPSVVHSLTPDTGCRVLVRLYELLRFLTPFQEVQRFETSGQHLETQWNERYVNLIKRLYELCDTHLIHCAGSVVKCESWKLLNQSMQERIRETGIFVEMRQPRAPPPRLSSLNRTYKRSASTGVTMSAVSQLPERGRSLTRKPSGKGEMQRINEVDKTPESAPEPVVPSLPIRDLSPQSVPEPSPQHVPTPETEPVPVPVPDPEPVSEPRPSVDRQQTVVKTKAAPVKPESQTEAKPKSEPQKASELPKPQAAKPVQKPVKKTTPPRTEKKTPSPKSLSPVTGQSPAKLPLTQGDAKLSPSDTITLSHDSPKKENLPDAPKTAKSKSPTTSPQKTRRLTQVVKPTVTKPEASKPPEPPVPAPAPVERRSAPSSRPSTAESQRSKKPAPSDQNTRPGAAKAPSKAVKRPTAQKQSVTASAVKTGGKEVKIARKTEPTTAKVTTKVQKVAPVIKHS